jgi:hypothetical protein
MTSKVPVFVGTTKMSHYPPVMTMDNDMVCETTEGTLEATKDGQLFPAPKGTVWPCRKGGTEMTTNKGQTVAIMLVIDFLPA